MKVKQGGTTATGKVTHAVTNPPPAPGEVWVNGKGDEIVVQDYDFAYAVVWSRTYDQHRLVSASHFGATYKLKES